MPWLPKSLGTAGLLQKCKSRNAPYTLLENHPGEQVLVHRHTYNTCQFSEEARTF